MKIVKPSFEILKEKDLTKKIEKVARLCYKSEDKITEGSDIKMINMLLERNHTAMLEHGVLTLNVDEEIYTELQDTVRSLYSVLDANANIMHRNYLIFTQRMNSVNKEIRYLITGNLRAWVETLTQVYDFNGLIIPEIYLVLYYHTHGVIDFMKKYGIKDSKSYRNVCCVDDYKTLTSAERMKHEHVTILFDVDRGVTHELVRMRECSFAQESTRYCNYSKGKFGKEITVIKPCFFVKNQDKYKIWKQACESAENAYMQLLDCGALPQEARDVLPPSLKASIYMTANLDEWHHIFALRACRATGPAHPQMEEVMIPALHKMQEEYDFAFGDLTAPL